MYEDYKDKGLEIVAFPSDQFGQQEPGDNAKIEKTIRERFGATFPIMEKSDINGKFAPELYKFIRRKHTFFDQSHGNPSQTLSEVPWNFSYFLINGKGRALKYYSPGTDFDIIEKDVNKVLE